MDEKKEKDDLLDGIPRLWLKKIGLGFLVTMLVVDSLALLFPELKNISPALERATIILHQLAK